MAKYISNRQQNLKIGIVSYTEDKTVFEVIGKVGIGTTNATSKLWVDGDGYFTGILTANRIISSVYGEYVGGSISGTNIVGTELRISGISTLGVTSATNLTAQSLVVSGITTLGFVTTSNIYSSGVVTATTFYGSFSGNASSATFATSSGIATYASSAGIATYATSSGIATYATSSGIATYATSSGIATYATNAGYSTSVIGGIASVTQLSVSGITTLGIITAGNIYSTGVITATSFSGTLSGYASSAGIATYATSSGIATYATNAGITTALQNSRTFQITGDVVASPISFDGTGNVSLAATIQPNSVGLGTDTTGDYVRDITGTANQITVTGGTGESSTPTLTIPSQFTAPQDVTVTRDLLVSRNLNVNGNITIGGISATLFTTELKISDPDIVLGFRTDGSGNDTSNDNTANHGGVALASTEGTPLVQLFIAGIETTPATYKKIMWFKSGTFSGLGTDAWLINYAVGIGSTQFPTGTRLAAGNVQFTQNDLAVVRNINASGVITATTFVGNLTNTLTLATSGTGLSGSTTFNNSGASTFTVTSNATNANTASAIVARDAFGNFSAGTITASLTGTATTTTNIPNLIGAITSNNTTTSLGSFTSAQLATALTDETGSGVAVFSTSPTLVTPVLGAATATSIVVGSGVTIDISGINVTGVVTATTFYGSFSGNASSATFATSSGIATYASSAGIATYATSSGIATYATSSGIATYATSSGIATSVISGIASVTSLSVSGISTVGVLTASSIGIGTTNATSKLWVDGDGYFTGILTANRIISSVYGEFVGGSISGTSLVGTSLSISGISTLGVTSATNLTLQQLNVSGITTLGFVTTSNIYSSGVVTATTFYGSFSGNASSATYATNAGISTNIKGGVIGNIPYQSAADTTAFLTNGSSGTILQSNGVGNAPTWVTAPPAAAITGLTIRDKGTIVGGANSVSTLNFVGSIVSVASTAGIATITFALPDPPVGGKFDTSIDNVLYIQPTGTLDIVGVGTTTTQITTLPSGSNKFVVHSIHVTNISNGDAEITGGFLLNSRAVPASISVSVGQSGGAGINTITVGSASTILIGASVNGTGNIGETTGIGSTAGFQYNTYVTSVDGSVISLSKPMSGRAVGVATFTPVSKFASRLPVPVGSAVELLKQPMILNALDSIVLQSTGAGTGIGSTSTAAISQTANSNILTVAAGAAITNFLASGMLIQPTGNNTGIQTNTFVGVGYTPGALTIPMTRPATVSVASTVLSFTDVVVPEDGALQATIVYQSSTDTAYLNGTGTIVAISSNTTSVTAGLSTIPVAYYSSGTSYPSIIQSIRVSNISDGMIYPGGDYPVWVGIGNSDTIFSWLAYNMVIPKNSSIELCESPKRIGIGQSIFAYSNTPYAIEIQVAGKQKI